MDGWEDPDENMFWDSPQDWLFSKIGGCGCGTDEIREMVWTVFDNLSTWDDRAEHRDLVHELILHLLNEHHLAEHGGAVFGSWLTDEGERVHQIIKEAHNG